MKINISDIKINHRKRDADPHKVKQLAESIERLGLLQPIVVTKDNVLISGLHRIEAYKLLGYKKIETEIKDFDEIKKELAEIDENLCRAELSILEQGEQLLQRDKLLSDLGIRAKNGRPRKGENGENNSPFLTTQMIARAAGLSERVAEQRKQIAKNISIEVKDKLRGTIYSYNAHGLMQLARQPKNIQKIAVKKILSGEASRAIKIDVNEPNVVKKAIEQAHTEFNVRKWKKEKYEIPDGVTLVCGDFRKICKEIKPDSIDLVLTDPLWNKESIGDFKDLGMAARHALKPGGFLISCVGTIYLPQIISHLLDSGLEYYWLGITRFTTGRTTVWYRRIWSYKRDFVIFYKPPLNKNTNFFKDVLESNKKEKDYHKYQQVVADFRYLISRFTEAGDVVLDPCMGAGTNVMASLMERRQCIGIDIDPVAVRATRARISDYLQSI